MRIERLLSLHLDLFLCLGLGNLVNENRKGLVVVFIISLVVLESR